MDKGRVVFQVHFNDPSDRLFAVFVLNALMHVAYDLATFKVYYIFNCQIEDLRADNAVCLVVFDVVFFIVVVDDLSAVLSGQIKQDQRKVFGTTYIDNHVFVIFYD